ncbi:MAG: UDP-3-O-(3-hydroxymyristoyl)glucosamine N-acyltransferase [Deltaproteobacteria bacterium]|jgi:UDP-3-O-[3-hydroxymyristoyl] glucosamine N-acyltransferase|nr:UDP-3-O-(3-hydroxymyristoyl)glucosamine N-acyltransferase [Deltaproteobacteria bacterium]
MIKLSSPKFLGSIVEEATSTLFGTLALLGWSGERVPVDVQGDPKAIVRGLSSAGEAEEGVLCFAIKRDYYLEARKRGATAIIVSPEILSEIGKGQDAHVTGQQVTDPQWASGLVAAPLEGERPALVVFPDPRLLFSVILGLTGQEFAPPWATEVPFFKDRASCQIGDSVSFGPNCYVGAKVAIGNGSRVGPGVFIDDNVTVGEGCVLHPGVVLRSGVRVGRRCQIHSNSVIGEDGFGYNQVPCLERGRLIHFKNPHLGGVVIGDDVEIGALAAIDRGLVADTVIGKGTKIDNLVQIGHNCQIGQDCVVVSQVGAAGHSQVGDRVFLLGQCGLSHGAKVGHDAIISGQSGVLGTVPPGRDVWTGTPVKPQREEYAAQVMVKKDLPKWRKFFRLFMKGSPLEDIRAAMAEGPDKP